MMMMVVTMVGLSRHGRRASVENGRDGYRPGMTRMLKVFRFSVMQSRVGSARLRSSCGQCGLLVSRTARLYASNRAGAGVAWRRSPLAFGGGQD